MTSGRRLWAYLAAVLAAGGLGVSLWLPWYGFRIPAGLIDTAEQEAQHYGALAPLIRQGAEYARALGQLHLTAWQAFAQTDAILLVLAVVGGGLALLAVTDRAAGVARVVCAAGGLAFALALYRCLSPPGPDGLLHPATGAYLALACAAIMLGAGWIAGAASGLEAWAAPGGVGPAPIDVSGDPAAWPTTHSVPPPAP